MSGVGKSTATRRVARRYDLWFHAINPLDVAVTLSEAESRSLRAHR